MTEQGRKEFIQYLRICTDRQVGCVLEKERAAGRTEFAELANAELERRGL